MDITETFQKMADCEEIQKNHIFFDGDTVIYLRFKEPSQETTLRRKLLWSPEVWIYHKHEVGGGHLFDTLENIDYIWLPRQDQLQEMIGLYGYKFSFWQSYHPEKPKELYWEGERAIGQWCIRALSMEQLWLAFYMSENHNKVWSGTKWELNKKR